MKRININGMNFEVHKSKYASVDSLSRYAGRTIYDCYDKPAMAKISIYNDWLKWAYENNVEYFGISSYNGFRFSLQGLIEYEETIYILNITSNSNKAYIIE